MSKRNLEHQAGPCALLLVKLMHSSGDNPNSLANKLKNRNMQSLLQRFMGGATKEPRRSSLKPVADFYGVQVDAFFNPELASRMLLEVSESLASRISAVRKKNNLSAEAVSQKSSIPLSDLLALESGANEDIPGAQVFPLAEALGVSARWLLTGGGSLTYPPILREQRKDIDRLVAHLSALDDVKVHGLMDLLGIRR